MDDTDTMYEDKVVSIGVVANDTDIDPIDPLSVTAVGAPSNGTAVKASDTTVTYTPNDDYNGTDSFGYTLSDGTDTDAGTVTITITAVNDPPKAVDDTATAIEDTTVQIAVVDNDIDPDTGDFLTILSLTKSANGETSAISPTTVTYKPKADFKGVDSFDYTLSDGTATATGTVNITVTPVNDAVTTAADMAVDINVVANDSDLEEDPLEVTSVTTPSNGVAAIVLGSITTVTYTPTAGFTGTDSFEYTLYDGNDTATGRVAIIVTAGTNPPATPTELTASAGIAQVKLNWTDPFNSSITGYEYSQSVSDSALVWNDIPISATGETNASSFAVTTGLTNGTTYYFRIRGDEQCGHQRSQRCRGRRARERSTDFR